MSLEDFEFLLLYYHLQIDSNDFVDLIQLTKLKIRYYEVPANLCVGVIRVITQLINLKELHFVWNYLNGSETLLDEKTFSKIFVIGKVRREVLTCEFDFNLYNCSMIVFGSNIELAKVL